MADRLPYQDTGVEPEGASPRMPRWVKLSGLTAVVLVLLVIGLMLISGQEGEHGPGRHLPAGEPAGRIEQEAPGGRGTGR